MGSQRLPTIDVSKVKVCIAMISAAITYLSYIQCRSIAIVNFAFLLELALAALPLGAEDEIILIEHLPGHRVHLQDFFWSGMEDTPTWLNPIFTLYKAHTIQHTATIYMPGDLTQQQTSDIQNRQSVKCVSCIEPTPTFIENVNDNVNVLFDDDPGPRYWLLTVLKAGESVPSKVELRLARLYKAAFTRQQQKHLGLLPEIHSLKSFPKREVLTRNQTVADMEIRDVTTNSASPIRMNEMSVPKISLLRMREIRIAKTQPTLMMELESRNDSHLKPVSNVNVGLIQVRMHNTSLMETGATKLIYTVHIGGKPVPAETAAKDMALLSAQEVALELGTPVLIQSEPYLKESRPLALSKKRDAWLLVGATSIGVLLLVIIVFGLLLLTKHKYAKDSTVTKPNHTILIKDEEYAPMASDIDNTANISETVGRIEVTNEQRRAILGNLSIMPGSQNIVNENVCDDISKNYLEGELKSEQDHDKSWNTQNYTRISRPGLIFSHVQGANIVDQSQNSEFMGSVGIKVDNLNTLEKDLWSKEVPDESMGSPHSYLSMPSCKQFPSMKSVEPLSKVLKSTNVKHLDVEFEFPEVKATDYNPVKENGDYCFSRTLSAVKDPGVLGPIVWDLKRKRATEGMDYKFIDVCNDWSIGDINEKKSEVRSFDHVFACVIEMSHWNSRSSTLKRCDPYKGNIAPAPRNLESGCLSNGPVGQARKRFNELLEDSFGLFGVREAKEQWTCEKQHQSNTQCSLQWYSLDSESRGKSAYTKLFNKNKQHSHMSVPTFEEMLRPHTSLLRNDIDERILETGYMGSHPQGAWGSRPLSAGPFHRPTFPEVEVVRVFADSQLQSKDSAVSFIAAIKKELGKFTFE